MSGLAVEASGLTRAFGEKRAVDALDLAVPAGTIFGFLGPNGCGKTTTMRLLTGLLRPSAGAARVLGHALPAEAEALKREIGYMTQTFSLYRDLTVAENLRFTADIHGMNAARRRRRIDDVLARFDLEDLTRQMAGSMSGGQRQRLALAAAVLHEPGLLFLDEPTSAVDPETRRDFWETLFDLSAAGVTIIVSTHFMDEAERCQQIAILDQGRKRADGAPDALMAGLPAQVVQVEGGDLRAAKRAMQGRPSVISVAQIGTRLRVLVDRSENDPVALVREAVTAGAEAHVVRPNLEDVFVVATRHAPGEDAAA
ncbi:putative ABC transporter ATP-binding protein YbhF [Pseudoruegeria aquimaris]|uniref:Putative ABC transporter ATP-binding protein YbhF n=1 Tax=Pseudoruegeria aquimaris TaxID=393663 RepID=A0A1Y5SWD2_9RHOB|nr:ABC transporter ATP-binding protein [Pseudoruegeria aquimaris]SLN49939.1 putative ABC transporter ATP-binding protein YbhF [Pseudoruegeria aquimaris]